MPVVSLNVNGRAHQVEADSETPLLWVIRDDIGLTGTKFGCGMALCGACTVHLDGEPIRSCITPISAAAGVTHERAGCPSTCTVQAPHWATPQPNLVPVRPMSSRITHRSGVCSSASTLWE